MIYKIAPKDKATRLKDAFNQGKTAANNGLTIGMCPYSGWQQVEERKRWLDGFEHVAYSKTNLWQPSNATQGDAFIGSWCGTCARDYQDSESCDICMRTMAFNITDPEYPKEWRYNEQGEPVCKAYIPEGESIPLPRDDRTIDMFEGVE